jgi:hypothetical protein
VRLSHTRPVASALFDEPNLVSVAGLVPVVKLAQDAGLRHLADEHLSVPWLVLACIAFNLTRAAATITAESLTRATTATIRRTLITVPARIANSARRLTLHLPTRWPWQDAWTRLFTHTCGPPASAAT